MDIETITLNNKITPYLICGFNGSDFISSYANESLNQTELFTHFINQLTSNSFCNDLNLTVYAHNLSGFDGIFLMRQLLPFGIIEPIIFNGRLISIKFKSTLGKSIVFKDSYLLLPLSLRDLCVAFGVTFSKGYFPFNFTDIFYTGVLPKYGCWTDIPLHVYESIKLGYKNKLWSFKTESIKYCKLDCQSLHEVLTKFNELIFNEFSINSHKLLTLPALAMRIYKTHYMPADTIYKILGEVEQNIRSSYTGGAVDVYIPHNRISAFFGGIKAMFKTLYYYDVNSLYPTVMSKFDMPVGKPVAFEGDIRKVDPSAYGVFFCKITSPDNLLHPIIQRRIKGKGTVAGLGTWESYISSLEMDNAVKYGYTFEIIKGYEFEKSNIFKNFVNKLFELRQQYEKGHPMNLIAKLLMNSLYGKFGMKTQSTTVEIFNLNSEAGKLALKSLLDVAGSSIQDFIEFDSNKYLFVRDAIADVFNDEPYHGSDVNIAIASTITAGARVFMSIFKNNLNFNLYYSDTDSAVTDRPLPAELVGPALGQMKLEYTIKKAVFLAPKVYGFITTSGDEIIKIKGVTHKVSSNIHYNELELLLHLDANRVFTQQKWYKSFIVGEITITDVLYNLKVTSNKRKAIYNTDKVFCKTEPLHYDEIINK